MSSFNPATISPYQPKIDLSKLSLSSSDLAPILNTLGTNPVLRFLDLSNTYGNLRDPNGKAENRDIGNKIVTALFTNTTLLQLNLNNNFLGLCQPFDIGRALLVNSTLTSLNFAGGLYQNSHPTIANALRVNSVLTRLDLSGSNHFHHLSGIAYSLEFNHTLTWLKLNNNNLTTDLLEPLAYALQTNSSLTHLDISENTKIGNEGAIHLATALSMNSTLTSLYLYDAGIEFDGARYLAASLAFNSTLQGLSLAINSITEKGAELFGSALEVNSTLTELFLNATHKGSRGAVRIADALKTNSFLTLLSLSANAIGDEGALALSEALIFNSTLLNLHLDHNKIKDDGCRAIATSLLTNTTLTDLDLSVNDIENSTLEVLAGVLWRNTSLTDLNLGRSFSLEVSNKSLEDFFRGLENNWGLKTLTLFSNNLTPLHAPHIAAAIKCNTALTKLTLSYNDFVVEGLNIIGGAYAMNNTLIDLDAEHTGMTWESTLIYPSVFDTARRNQQNDARRTPTLFSLLLEDLQVKLYEDVVAASLPEPIVAESAPCALQ